MKTATIGTTPLAGQEVILVSPENPAILSVSRKSLTFPKTGLSTITYVSNGYRMLIPEVKDIKLQTE